MRAASESQVRHIIPPEFLEPNWRFWSFVFISILGSLLIIMYKVPVYDGLTDPFYTPTVLILPLVVLFRLTCYAYRKDYHRHLFNHPNSCATDVRLDSKSRGYSGETGFFRIENVHRYFMYTAWAILPFPSPPLQLLLRPSNPNSLNQTGDSGLSFSSRSLVHC